MEDAPRAQNVNNLLLKKSSPFIYRLYNYNSLFLVQDYISAILDLKNIENYLIQAILGFYKYKYTIVYI